MAINIGIDLGTTNSCISYLEGKEPLIIPNPEGSRVIPSMVALDRENKRIFGNIAKRQFITNNENTIWGIKRLIGRKYESEEIQRIQQRIGYTIVEGNKGDARVKLGDRILSPEEISSMILGYLKEVAESYLGEEVGDTVITVPAFFNDAQRQGTKAAAEIAELNVIRIINEPTAALIAYRDKIQKDGLYAVYDLGGGTFDISIVEVKNDIFKVISTTGDTFLGGNDFDSEIVEWILNETKKEISVDLFEDKNSLQRIIQDAEKAKIELSFSQETTVSIPYLYHFPDGNNYHFKRTLTRAQFEHATTKLIDRTVELVKKSMEDIDQSADDIERIILVGGQSRMPLIFDKLTELFQREPFIDVNPEEVVAQGAVLQSEIIKGKVKDLLLLDVTPLSLGVEIKGDKFTKLIDKNSTIPIKKSKIFTTITDNQQIVTIHVLQGEREVASQNKSLGYFNLVGISPAPKGIPQIEVSFEIDANGIVKVSALDKQTRSSQSIKIESTSGLSPEEIERMINEAKQYKEHDLVTIRINELKDQLNQEIESSKMLLYKNEKNLKSSDKSNLRTVIEKTQQAISNNELKIMESMLNKIHGVRIKISGKLISDLET